MLPSSGRCSESKKKTVHLGCSILCTREVAKGPKSRNSNALLLSWLLLSLFLHSLTDSWLRPVVWSEKVSKEGLKGWYSAQPPRLWAKPHFLNTRGSPNVAGRPLQPCGCSGFLSLWRTQYFSQQSTIHGNLSPWQRSSLGLANWMMRLGIE